MQVEQLGIHSSVGVVFPPAVLTEELSSIEPDVHLVESPTDLAAVDAVVTFAYDDAFLDRVEWVHSIQAGVDRFPFDEFEANGVALTNSSGIHSASVGETVAGYMLSFARRLHDHRDSQGAGEWNRPAWDEPFTLTGEPVTVVGLGALGQGVARCADGLGMDVTGVRRKPITVPNTRAVYTPDRLHEAIEAARFVVVTLPLTDETDGMFGSAAFDAMRDDAYFINVGRGPVVQQDALVDALDADALAGAALDVFEEEPLPAESPLWDADDVIVTPHAAAADRDYHRNIAALVRTNVERTLAGSEFVNRVV
jgi:D-2-hydroxyacid dehydrogenase (NADP+)